MSNVTTSIDIAAPPERVWEVLMDPRRLEDWVTIHRKLGRVSDRELVEGSTLEQTLHLRGATFKVRWTVEQADAPRSCVWDGRGPARSRAHSAYHLSEDGGGTHFDYENEFHTPFGPLGSVASRALIGDAAQREADASLRRLKELVESG